MLITKEVVRDRLLAYLNHTITLTHLVHWAEKALHDDKLDTPDAEMLRDILTWLGRADVQKSGLAWEDCHTFLTLLGYQVQVEAFPAKSSPTFKQVEPTVSIGQWLKSSLTGRTIKAGVLIGLVAFAVIAVAWFIISMSSGDNRLTASMRRLSPPPTPTATRPPEPTRVPLATPAPTDTPAPTATPPFFDVNILVGCAGIARGCFDLAQSLGVDGQGNIYAADDSDFIGGRVQVFDPTGEYITQWLIGDKDSDLDRIAVDHQGTVYAISNGDIYRYQGASGKLLGKLEYSGSQGFQDVATTADGKLVASWNKESQDDIVVFDSAGNVAKVLPQALSKMAGGAAESVTWLTVDKQGNIYASGKMNPGIYKFAPDGKFLGKFAEDKVPGGALLAVDAQGRMVALVHSDMLIFAPDGSFLGSEDWWSANDMVFNDRNELLTIDDSEIIKFALMR